MAVVGLSLVAVRSAHAYIDPGTGMTFVSGIGGFLAGLAALALGAVAMTFKRCLAFLRSIGRAIKRALGGRHSA